MGHLLAGRFLVPRSDCMHKERAQDAQGRLKMPMILFNCWRHFELCVVPKDCARRRSAGQSSRPHTMVQLRLLFLTASSLALRPHHL